MGKTIFVKVLDPFGLYKLALRDNYQVACYYLDGVYCFKMSPFLSELNDRIRRNPEGNLLLPLETTPPSLSPQREDQRPSEAFLECLTFYVSAMQEHLGLEGVLVCIDALDEIPTGSLSETNILDFIPRSEDLTEGAYILLSARLHRETLQALNERVRNLSVVSSLEVLPEEQPNRGLLEAYLKKELKTVFPNGPVSKDLIEKILTKGENRFIYVSHIKDLALEGNLNADEVPKLPPAKSLYDEYLRVLEKIYPEKYLHGLKAILLALVTAPEAITPEELLFLTGEKRINFRFFGAPQGRKKDGKS